MIIRIFVALLALNMIAFVVRAEASERVFADEVPAENVYQLQEEMSGDFEREESDMYATIGSRLLSLSLSDSDSGKKSYASDRAKPDHGIALLEEGACLNLRWNFCTPADVFSFCTLTNLPRILATAYLSQCIACRNGTCDYPYR